MLQPRPTKREAVKAWLRYQTKKIGPYRVLRTEAMPQHKTWSLCWIDDFPGGAGIWSGKRDRTLAAAIREDRRRRPHWLLAQPDPMAPDTLGWRVWFWSESFGHMMSPHRMTVWETPELRVEHWDQGAAARGFAGIHAALMPRDWRITGSLAAVGDQA